MIGADRKMTDLRRQLNANPMQKVLVHRTLPLAFAVAGNSAWHWAPLQGSFATWILQELIDEIASPDELVLGEIGSRIRDKLPACDAYPEQSVGVTIALRKDGQASVGLQSVGINCTLAIGESGKPVAPEWMEPSVYQRIHDPAARTPEEVAKLVRDVMSETIAEAQRRDKPPQIGWPIDIVTVGEKVTHETVLN